MDPIVIDHGSYRFRAGFAGEETPRAQFLSMVGRPKTDNSEYLTDLELKGSYIGDRLLPLIESLQIRYPIEYGHVTNWDDVEKIWRYVFCERLKVNSEEHPVLLTETTRNPKSNRELATQIMFETFNVPAFYLAQQAVLSLLSVDRSTGVVLDVGHNVTNIVPVYEGHNLVMGNRILDFGGSYVTHVIRDGLKKAGVGINSKSSYLALQDIVEKSCFTSLDYDKDLSVNDKLIIEEKYQLPDGNKIYLGLERFKSVELFFQPIKFGFEVYGVHELLNDSISKLDKTIRRDLYSNIVISGGASMYPNFDTRLEKEMLQFHDEIKVIASPDRHLAAWRGGALLASKPEFLYMCITKYEYDEYGPSLVHKKCF